jgi:hypothetical protein
MTDMGRIYIILGAPASIESSELTRGIYPCQVWYYYGDKAKGLLTPGTDEGLRGGKHGIALTRQKEYFAVIEAFLKS